MEIPDRLTDVRPYVILAIITAFIIGDAGDWVPTVLVVMQMLQITASLVGIDYRLRDIGKDLRRVGLCIFFCFVINSATAVVCAYLFPCSDEGIFFGWIMIAAMPCAISIITMALTMDANRTLSVLGLTGVYIVALAVSPVITIVFIGDAVPPLQILKYLVLFVAIPLVAAIPLNKLEISRKPRLLFINILLFLLVALAVGKNRSYMLDDPNVIILLTVFLVIRIFVIGSLMMFLFRRAGTCRGDSLIYAGMSIWKNTGMAMTMCIILIPDMPQAALPCVISVLVEMVWFAITNEMVKKYWPAEVCPE